MAKRRFCGRECSNAAAKGQRKVQMVTMTCTVCPKTFEVYPGWVRNGRRKYCSKECRWKAYPLPDRTGKRHTPEARAKMGATPTRGERSSQWKGGRYRSRGYVFVMVDLLPPETQALVRQMTSKTYVPEHRAVAARMEGRPLTPDDVVHHVNGVKADNRPENLMVIDRADHSTEHREIERKFRELQAEVERLRVENVVLRSRPA